MLIFKNIKDIDRYLISRKKEGNKIAFAPTMGALHQGHISLIDEGKRRADLLVCSIFVNPTQFNDKADFDKYPNTISKDIEMLADVGCDVLFLPAVKEMYPDGFSNPTSIDFGHIANILEGEHRPGHFDGMAQVVEKLLRIVKPHILLMGQKDYQQQLIVRELIKKRKMATELVTCPTLREKDGLAMSSRNVRLDAAARKLAVTLNKLLKDALSKLKKGSNPGILSIDGFKKLHETEGITPDYFAILDADNLMPVTAKTKKVIALTAAFIGGVRLIDNMLTDI
jgi:pantoate--beta-alanine ligase